MKLFRITVSAIAFAAVSSAFALDIVVPNANTAAPGPSNQAFPFNAGSAMRYQQVFASSQFGGASGIIQNFAYRLDEVNPSAFSASVACSIWFSHTTKAPQGLDTTFDNNHGADKTLVFSGVMNISSAGNPSLFDIVFDVNDVFAYNGTSNLLLEVVVSSGNITAQFDAAGTGIGTGGTPWTSRLWAFGAGATTGSTAGDDGMVTRFGINAVPEPASMALLGIGSLLVARRRKR